MDTKIKGLRRQIIQKAIITNLSLEDLPGYRPLRKCLLPDCPQMTNHRGGYCCREHCLTHRELIKRRLKNG